MPNTTNIHCPKCGHEFNVEDVLAQQIEEKYREELGAKIADLELQFQTKEKALASREQELKQKQTDIDTEVEKRLKAETGRKEKEIKERIAAEYESRIASLSEESEKATRKIRELKSAQLENEKLKRQLDDQKQDLAIQFEKEFSEKLKETSEAIQKREAEKIGLKLRDREEVIKQLKEQVNEMQRKAEQGSMQMQGEVQELELEDMLREVFPFDVIEEVGKGIKGADVIQTVRNRIGADCGKIIFESKRTKAFGNDWISKLKADAVAVKADVCVIVTETLPQDLERIGQIDNVWICSFSHAKGLVLVLRDSLIRIHEAFGSQANKGEKMQMLYDYLTSNEFKLQVGAIIDGFTGLQDSYIKEKRSMERIWKEREKQLEKVLLNTNHFIGSIKGIAGSSIENLRLIGEADNIFELEPETEE